ncbi:C8orf37 protein, partial [Pelagophyceae sp. CCMP2097]
CDALRCTKCDFDVLQIPQRAWAADVNYLFLRNFSPDVSRLEAKLVVADASTAYCCQCAWRSCGGGFVPLSASGEALRSTGGEALRWVCKGH